MNPPKPVTGASPQAAWMNRQLAATNADRLKSGPGYRVRTMRSGGQTIEILATAGGGRKTVTANLNFAEYSGTPGDYTIGDVVIISSGTGIGTYGCLTATPTTDPWLGAPDWIQFASNGTGPWL